MTANEIGRYITITRFPACELVVNGRGSRVNDILYDGRRFSCRTRIFFLTSIKTALLYYNTHTRRLYKADASDLARANASFGVKSWSDELLIFNSVVV